MAKGTRICKVCGKEYEYCKTWLSTDKFRYQDVACSPECGAIYFAKIAESRGLVQPEAVDNTKMKKSSKKSARKETAVKHEDTMPNSDAEAADIDI